MENTGRYFRKNKIRAESNRSFIALLLLMCCFFLFLPVIIMCNRSDAQT
jgi:hypothetical protein